MSAPPRERLSTEIIMGRRPISHFNGSSSVSRFRHSLMGLVGAFVITGVLNLASIQAADQADPKDKSNRADLATADRSDEMGSIPDSIRKLNLTEKQTEQIQKIARDYDQSINTVWNQFRDRYMQTIRLESSMLAGIEDQLTDTQRQKIRDHRRRTARHVKVVTSASERTTEKPNAAAKSDSTNANFGQAIDKPGENLDVDLANVGVSLTAAQEAHADKIHQKYRVHFKPLNREIHSLHNRLIALESEKLAEIEQVLTKDQLEQLRSNRQNALETPRVTLRIDEAK